MGTVLIIVQVNLLMMYVYVYLFAYVSFTCVYIGDTYAYELI